jgi:hypothetical protein
MDSPETSRLRPSERMGRVTLRPVRAARAATRVATVEAAMVPTGARTRASETATETARVQGT